MQKYILITCYNGICVRFFDSLEAATAKRNSEIAVLTGADEKVFLNEEFECDDYDFDKFNAFANVGGFTYVYWRIVEIPE